MVPHDFTTIPRRPDDRRPKNDGQLTDVVEAVVNPDPDDNPFWRAEAGELDAYPVELLNPDDDLDDPQTDDAVEMAFLQELGVDLDDVEPGASPLEDARPMAGVEMLDMVDLDDELAA
jgi:hypothetical protein